MNLCLHESAGLLEVTFTEIGVLIDEKFAIYTHMHTLTPVHCVEDIYKH